MGHDLMLRTKLQSLAKVLFASSHVDLTPASKLGLTNFGHYQRVCIALPKSELPECLSSKNSDEVLNLVLIIVRYM